MDRIRWGKRDNDLVSSEFIKMAVHPTFHCPTKPTGLTEVLHECVKRLREVGIQLLRGISTTLGFEECYIEKRMKLESGCDFITPNDYPLHPYSENQLGQAPHYDPGLLILLLPGLSNGLQLEHHGKWINANPQPNSIVVSIADQIEILTNGKYKSVFHRVVLNNNVRRISLPLFIGPSLDTMVSPLPECVDEHHPPAYLVKTYKELLEANQYHEIDVKSCLKNVRL
ncbi:2'-deoxymugineic-acid 2'-dioxygenase-like [Quercus lobata]|nr:2'-deoxymugineic-acid 2'-dioxygenase-like [Quercus lobata]